MLLMVHVPTPLQRLCQGIDYVTEITGKAVSWLTLILIINTCAVVILRYFLDAGSIALQEGMTYLHASLFMLAMAFTLKQGGHVRVDVFYSKFSPRKQALVDVLGTLLFLIPVSLLILIFSWDYVSNSWAIREVSTESAGIPYIFVLKTLMIILPVTLILQGISEMIKNALFFLGVGGSHTPEKMELL